MSTECSGVQLALQPLGRRPVVARFDAAPITSDGGAVLLREVDRRIDLLGRLAGGFVDHRDPGRIQHSLVELVSQRVLGLALGYEDLNDHDRLVEDHAIAISDPAIAERVAPVRFYAATYRLFRLPGLEPDCEDYGQAVVYRGTVPRQAGNWVLDKHHRFPTGKVVAVCGNTYRMLHESRFAPHFEFFGEGRRHLGIFEGCGTGLPFNADAGATGASCC